MKTLSYRIEQTGGMPVQPGEVGEFYFQHMVLTEDAELEESELKALAETHNVDFISKEEEGTISFLHVSQPESLDSITEKGLIPNGTGYIGDLGYGIYVIEEYDTTAVENVLDYVEGICEAEEILLLQGTYTGKMTRCLYGAGHEGYIVLKSNVLAENLEDWAVKNLEDAWFTGLFI